MWLSLHLTQVVRVTCTISYFLYYCTIFLKKNNRKSLKKKLEKGRTEHCHVVERSVELSQRHELSMSHSTKVHAFHPNKHISNKEKKFKEVGLPFEFEG